MREQLRDKTDKQPATDSAVAYKVFLGPDQN